LAALMGTTLCLVFSIVHAVIVPMILVNQKMICDDPVIVVHDDG
jgi:hypothetical protein